MAEHSPIDVHRAAGAPSLRERAVAIQVIGSGPVDRSASRQRRLGASLLLALYLGWNPLMQAMSGPVPFHSAMGRFLVVFLATVVSIHVVGNLYDDYADRTAVEGVRGRPDRSPTTGDQPPSVGAEGLGSDR